MITRVQLRHQTRYEFDREVQLFPHVLRLRPAPHCRTPVERFDLQIDPQPDYLHWLQDPFSNYLARLIFLKSSSHLELMVTLTASLPSINPFDFFIEPGAETYPFRYESLLARYLTANLEIREQGPRLREWLDSLDRTPCSTVEFLLRLNRALAADIVYRVRLEPGVLDCETTLGDGVGSCRDSSWVLVQALRHLGIAARFVSGYLLQLNAYKDDVADLHAWAEAYIPGAGWIGLDPTSGLLAGEGHIPLACVPDPAGAGPVEGATEPCGVRLSFDSQIVRIDPS